MITEFAPGDHVATTSDGTVFVYAGVTPNDSAILVSNLRADLRRGFRGYPAVTGILTAVADGMEYAAITVPLRRIRRV
jgi:hypothetical protein